METKQNNEHKTLAILSIVFGAIALAFSWVPIINNLAAIFAVAGAVMGIIALVLNRKSRKTKSIVGLVLSIVSFAIVMSTQSAYSNAIDKATGISTSNDSTDKISKKTFKVGQDAKYKGVTYKVNNVTYNNGDEFDKPADGKQYVRVNITITNNSKDKISYNDLDFKLDDNGNQTSMTHGMAEDDALNSGDLTPGASVTGSLVGEGNVQNKLKLIYDGNMFSKEEKVTFALN